MSAETSSVGAERYFPRIGDDVTATLRGRLTAYDDEMGKWTLTTDGTDHVPWQIELHWSQPFERMTSSAGAGGLPRDTRGGDETAGVGSTPYLTPAALDEIDDAASDLLGMVSAGGFRKCVRILASARPLTAEVRRLTALCESQQAEITRLQTAHSRAADTARALAAGLQAHP